MLWPPRNRRARAPGSRRGQLGPEGGTAIPARGGAGTGRTPALPPSKGLAGRRGPVCSALPLFEGGQEAEFQSGFTLCYRCAVPPSTPQAAFQNLGRGGPAPGEIRLSEEARVTVELLGRSRALPSLTPNIPEGWSPGPPGPYPGIPWGPRASRGRSGEEDGKSGGSGVQVLMCAWDKTGFRWFFFFFFLGGDPGLFCQCDLRQNLRGDS